MSEEVKSRICTECKITKSLSDFFTSREGGRIYKKCKICSNAERKRHRKERRIKLGLKCRKPETLPNGEIMTYKTCSTCNTEKEITYFAKHKNYKGGRQTECKQCMSKRGCEFYFLKKDKLANPHKYPETSIPSSKTCSKCGTDKPFNCFSLEKRGKYGRCSVCKRCRLDLYVTQRMKRDPNFALKILLRARLSSALKATGAKKLCKIMDLVGCSINELKEYIQSKFEPGMTWENRGLKTWHLDHLTACCIYDLTKEEEQRKCFHFTNLYPRWATTEIAKENGSNRIGNINKGKKVIGVDFHEVLL